MMSLSEAVPAHCPTGYQMIKSAEIRNFRCFDFVKLTDCRTLNVVVGPNASGKTAILESLFLALGVSPEIALRLRTWRGFEGQMGGKPSCSSPARRDIGWA
jgi:AAA ATPase-like protein